MILVVVSDADVDDEDVCCWRERGGRDVIFLKRKFRKYFVFKLKGRNTANESTGVVTLYDFHGRTESEGYLENSFIF